VDGWSASLTNWIQANSATLGLLLGGAVAIAVLSALLKRLEPLSSDQADADEADAAIADEAQDPLEIGDPR
jgi:hypothetical protein